MKDTIHIIGGGISGCTFAYFLKNDFNIILYEQSPELGGMLYMRKNLENIPWQQVPGILHTNKKWIIDLISQAVKLYDVKYQVSINPLFDFRYYNFPFNKSSIKTMPWHWKEAILQDLETSNGEYSNNLKKLIVNFYGETIYDIFYKNYFQRLFGTNNINITEWFRQWMRDVNSEFDYYIDKYIMFPVNEGWNSLFNFLTHGIEIKYNTKVSIKDFNNSDFIIVTTDVTKFTDHKEKIYSYGSFEIDSTIYKQNTSDTIIYPNYTPYVFMTQYGKLYKVDKNNNEYEKNIIVKTYIDDGDIPLYPIPIKKKQQIYKSIISKYKNIIFAGRIGSWSFMHMDDIISQAQKISAEIKHSRRIK